MSKWVTNDATVATVYTDRTSTGIAYFHGFRDGKRTQEAHVVSLAADVEALRTKVELLEKELKTKYEEGFRDGQAEGGEWNLT